MNNFLDEFLNSLSEKIEKIVRDCMDSYFKEHLASASAEDKLLTPEEASEFLNISTTTLWRRAKEGKLNPIPFGGKTVRYRLSDLIKKGGRV